MFLWYVRVLSETCSIICKNCHPTYNLTRTNTTFKWTDQSQQAFEQLKACLMNPPIFVKAQVNQPFLLTTDASNAHIGGVLSQIQSDGSNKPIGYF